MDARAMAAMRQAESANVDMGMSAAARGVGFEASERSRAPIPRPVPPRVAETAPVIGSNAQFPPETAPLSREHLGGSDTPAEADSAHSALSLVVYALQLMLFVVLVCTVFALPMDLRWVWLVIAGHVALVAAGAALMRAAPNSWAAQNLPTPLFAAHATLSLVFLCMTAYRIVTLYRAETLGDAVLGRSVRAISGSDRERESAGRARKRMKRVKAMQSTLQR
jgi:hypothetical protein